MAVEQRNGNGIFVEGPKVYDDAALQLLLGAAKARLATLQAIHQDPLTSRIGAITGATLQQQAFSAQIMGPPLPGSTVTSLGATGNTQSVAGNTSNTTVAPSGTTQVDTSNQTTTTNAGLPAVNVTTTNPQQSASVPTSPQLSSTLPTSGYNISSLDALSEMMQLNNEIAELQLLLEGAVSDRYVAGQNITKARSTLGFTISISTPASYKDAVAVVEVEAATPGQDVFSFERPNITALLPREKTYNTAALTDSMASVGGGIVTQVISGGASFMRGRKTYYLVKDQDTLAVLRGGTANTVNFGWQFRPVLGRKDVQSGLRQTFVQLSVPISNIAKVFGVLKIRTYWQEIDRKRGILKEVIPGSVNETSTPISVPVYDTRPRVNVVAKDLGAGYVQANLEGNFLAGTYVRVGNAYYRDGSPGFTSEMSRIRFVASASDVAKYGSFLVSRDGTETPLNLKVRATSNPTISHSVEAYDANNSIVTATLQNVPSIWPNAEDEVMVIGGKVFGLSDAPIERISAAGQQTFRAIVPNSVLLSAPAISVRLLFGNDSYEVSSPTSARIADVQEKIISIGPVGGGNVAFLLYGSRLANAQIVVPRGISVGDFSAGADKNSLRYFELSEDLAKSLKQVVLIKEANERPIFVSMPSVETPKLSVTLAAERVGVGTDELSASCDFFDKLKTVKFGERTIFEGPVAGKKTIRLTGLSRLGVTLFVGPQKLEFDFGDFGKITKDLEVVSGRVELVFPVQ